MSEENLPNGWKKIRLEEAITLQRGKDLTKSQQRAGKYPVVGSSGIIGYHSEFVARGPGVTIGRSGSVGRVTWVDRDYWAHNTSLWVKDFHGNEERFVYYWLNFLELGKYTEGVSVPTLNRNLLHPLEVHLPPLTEQNAIARALRAVQEAKAARQKELALERERKAALMQHLFTYGTRGEARKQTEIGEMPESWGIVKLGEVARIVSGGTPERDTPEYWNGDISWVKTGEINYSTILKTEESITKEGLDNSSARVIQTGALLMAMYGQGVTRGRVAILGIDAAINQACAAILLPDDFSTEFLFFFLTFSYEKIRLLGHGANQKNLNSALIRSIIIPRPSLPEQKEIATLLTSDDKKLSALQRECEALDELFRAMLEELMTGKLPVQPLLE